MRLGYPKKKTVLRGGWRNRWYFVYSGYDRSSDFGTFQYEFSVKLYVENGSWFFLVKKKKIKDMHCLYGIDDCL